MIECLCMHYVYVCLEVYESIDVFDLIGLEAGLVPQAEWRIWHSIARVPCRVPAGERRLQRVPLPH